MISAKRTNQLRSFLAYNALNCGDLGLLDTALCYSHHKLREKARKRLQLELLGDAVWNFFVVDYLFRHFSNENKGYLAKLKSYLVSSSFLSHLAMGINVIECVVVQEGAKINLKKRESILESVYESFVAAVYLSEGLIYFQNWQSRLLNREIALIQAKLAEFDQKTALQEKLHQYKIVPNYLIERVEGPSHDKKYTVSLYIGDNKVTSDKSSSIKKAEKRVAEKALKNLSHFLKSDE